MPLYFFSFDATPTGILEESSREDLSNFPFFFCDPLCEDRDTRVRVKEALSQIVHEHLEGKERCDEPLLKEAFLAAHKKVLEISQETQNPLLASALILARPHLTPQEGPQELLVAGVGDVQLFACDSSGELQEAFSDIYSAPFIKGLSLQDRIEKAKNCLGIPEHDLQVHCHRLHPSLFQKFLITSYGAYEQASEKQLKFFTLFPEDKQAGVTPFLKSLASTTSHELSCVAFYDTDLTPLPDGPSALFSAKKFSPTRRWMTVALTLAIVGIVGLSSSHFFEPVQSKSEATAQEKLLSLTLVLGAQREQQKILETTLQENKTLLAEREKEIEELTKEKASMQEQIEKTKEALAKKTEISSQDYLQTLKREYEERLVEAQKQRKEFAQGNVDLEKKMVTLELEKELRSAKKMPTLESPLKPLEPYLISPLESKKTCYKGLHLHTIRGGETLMSLSQHYYGTSKRWKDIFNANRERITNKDRLLVGATLLIPDAPE